MDISPQEREVKQMYKLIIKIVNKETDEEMIIYQGNHDTYHKCEMVRNRIVSNVNKTRYYTSSRIEFKRGEDK